jgi:uncharacterized alpha-E superfamily protein
MLSRVADAVYWMARYIERAENIARFVDVNLHLALDLRMMEHEQWMPLVTVTGDEEAFRQRYGRPTQETVIKFLGFDRDYSSSIYSCLYMARENARSVREIISSEMWEQVNRFYLMLKDAAGDSSVFDDPHAFFDDVKKNSHLFTGLAVDTMSHGEAWHFSRLGRLLERADKTSRILDVKYFMLLPRIDYVGTPYDNIQWAALLKSTSALEMYRKLHHRITPRQVTGFLIFDREFPRAIHYCLIKAEDSLHTITGSPAGTFQNPAERKLGKLRAELDYSDVDDVFEKGLHEYLDGIQVRFNEIGQAVFDTFFNLRLAP